MHSTRIEVGTTSCTPTFPQVSRTAALALLALVLAACGTSPGDGDDGPDGTDPSPDQPVELEGPPGTPAVEATEDVEIQVDYGEQDFSEDPSLREGGRVLRSEVEIGFDPGASVAEIRDLLEGIEGGIVSMVEGLPVLVVQIPEPGSIADLEAVLADLRDDDRVLYAMKSVVVDEPEPVRTSEPDELAAPTLRPQDVPGHVSRMARIDHHLAVRAHAAWNAADALPEQNERPGLVIGDSFGNGTPGNGYDADFTGGDFASGNANDHGHHVLGIVTGAYEEDTNLGTGRNDVTGLYPGTLDVRAVDLRRGNANTWPRRQNLLIRRIRATLGQDPDARAVVNTSLNSRSLDSQETHAFAWIVRVRGRGAGSLPELVDAVGSEGSGLESRFVHATSAGNANFGPSGATRWPADENSLFANAALNDVTRTFPPPVGRITVPALINTAVVEDRVNTLHARPDPDGGPDLRPHPGCADNGSIMGGTISAIGTRVWSFSATGSTAMSGTSMATPEVAALAAWAWSLDPDLSPEELLELLEDTALDDPTTSRSPAGLSCNSVAPQPVIDAYATTVAAGGEDVVRAILDLGDDGTFDEQDLNRFETTRTSGSSPLDYGEFDLNGNGRAFAHAQGERFDLDLDGTIAGTTRTYVNERGVPVNVDYDEADLNDLDVLCFFAYSSLYQGDEEVRDDMLANDCSGTPVLEITSPADGDTFREDDPRLTLEAVVDPPSGASAEDYEIAWSYEGEGDPVELSRTSLSGESFEKDDLPCENLLLRAEIEAPNVGTVTDVVSVRCLPQQETFFLNVSQDAGGTVRSDGDVGIGANAQDELVVGDDADDRAIQGNLQVTLATLPEELEEITDATLSFTVNEAVNLPATDMSEFRAYHVDYGDDLGPNDFGNQGGMEILPGGVASTTDFAFGRKDLDVTGMVQEAWADRDTRGERVQFLLRFFPAMSNESGTPNQLQIAYEDRPGTYRLPALEITVRNY